MRLFEPGDAVALREVWRGRIWGARAATIVDDRDELTTFFVPPDSPRMMPTRDGRLLRIPEVPFELALGTTGTRPILSFGRSDAWSGTLLFFGPDGSADHWYVNLQEPLRRTVIGFDSLDLKLDVVVELDGTWRWKDEDELKEAINRGVIAADVEARLRAEGERAVARIARREPPFDRDWTTWRPDPAWAPPVLPERWDRPEP